MTSEQWLLIKLAEECAEVIKECTKSLNYGLNHTNPYNKTVNSVLLVEELNDILGVSKLLVGYEIIPILWDDINRIESKKNKVLKSLEYAKSLGIVTE